MIAAVLAVVTSAQQTPTERLVQFMNNATQRGIKFTVSKGGQLIQAKLSYQLPAHQYFEVSVEKARSRFIQTPKRITYINDNSQLYYEYKGYDFLIGPPPETNLMSDIYPSFLWNWSNPESLKSAKFEKSETLNGIQVDWVKQTVNTEVGIITIRIAISKDGSPKIVSISDPQSGLAQYEFQQFTWPYIDILNLKYQPPTGYMLGEASKMHFPKKYGESIDFANWGVDVAKLNKNGVAIIVSASGSKPDEESLEALTEMQIALDKLGVKTVEVHLDSSSAPKRPWPVTLDQNGKILDQLDVPVTPYIFFVNEKNIVLRAWAGYAKDQRSKLVKTAVKAFSPPEEEE